MPRSSYLLIRAAMAAALPVFAGCGADARVELAAADVIRSAADQMATAVNEYHGEVCQGDDMREAELIAAFVARVRMEDPTNSEAVEQHTQQFKDALAKTRADRGVEWQRMTAACDNIDTLREVADGLQRMGISSLTLQDDLRRYLDSWMAARTRAQAGVASQGGTP